jgi:transcriptional regulator with XRE-family HTH domain
MTEKTIAEWREELGITREEMARDMQISERALLLLEASGQTYPNFDAEWVAPISERYGYEKVFWLEPAEAVKEWEAALKLLGAFTDMACNTLDNQALIAILGDATTRAREELAGCRELLENFQRQEQAAGVVDGG